MSKNNKINRSIQFKNGIYSSVVTIVVIAIVVVVNLIVSSLPSDKTTFDTSGTDYYSIEDSTRTFLGGISSDINLYILSDTSGQYDDYVETMCGVFEDASDKIKLKKIDVAQNPTFSAAYDATDATSSSVIVENSSTGKYSLIDYSDLIYSESSYDDSGNTYSTYYYDAEGQLLSALNYVTSETTVNVYEVTGHGEISLSDYSFDEVLEKCNYTLNDTALSLLTIDAIPDDCDVLFICSPYSDFAQSEVDMVEDYMAGGGNVVFIYNNIYYGSDYYNTMTNFNSLLAYIGIKVDDGWILENDTNHYYSNQYTLLPNISSSSALTSSFSDSILLSYFASPVKQIDATGCTSTFTNLLTTSSNYSVYFYDSSLEKATADTAASSSSEGYTVDYTSACSIATYVTSEFDEATSKSLVIGCASFLEPLFSGNTYVNNNYKMITNAIADMTGEDESLYVEPKSLDEHYNVTTENQVNLYSLIYLGLIPVTILIAGFCVWYLRRSK